MEALALEKQEAEEEEEEDMAEVDLNTLQSRRRSKRSFVISEDDGSGGVNAFKGKVEDEVEAKQVEHNELFRLTNILGGDLLVAAEKGIEPGGSTNEFSEVEDVTAAYHPPKPNIGDNVAVLREENFIVISSSSEYSTINSGPVEILIENNSTSISFPPPEVSTLEKGTDDNNGRAKQHPQAGMLKGAEEVAIAEIDVERVLETQETHDLFCPNCNSCITKRVILRRRKRKIQEISDFGEVIKADDPVTSTLVEDRDIVLQDSSENEHAAVHVQDVDTERDVYRCLSCFSIFVRAGNGFKCWLFGDKTVEENLRIPVQVSPTEVTSFPNTTVDSVKQGTGFKFWMFGGKVYDKHVDKQHIESSQEVTTIEAAVIEPAMSVVGKSITQGVDQGNFSIQVNVGESIGLPNFNELQLNLDAPASAALLSDPKIESSFSLPAEQLKPEKESSSTMPTPEKPTIVMTIEEHRKGGVVVPDSSNETFTAPNKPKIVVDHMINTAIKYKGTGKDVIIQIDASKVQPESSETRPPTDDAVAEERVPLLVADAATIEATADGSRPSRLDVVRAMVYGGLAESITSLSVVTSAVGADSATLNVLVLGVANVVGGLFVLAHNLRVLRHETVTRYEELLGHTGHFVFHATAAVLSYLIFGLLPPIIYAFSFRKSNNKDLKLVTLASSSLLCILLLSIGKAHIRSPPKQYIKTITYYVTLVIMVSGGSYILGDLLKLLMDKLGWFSSTDSLTMHVAQGRSGIAVSASS